MSCTDFEVKRSKVKVTDKICRKSTFQAEAHRSTFAVKDHLGICMHPFICGCLTG